MKVADWDTGIYDNWTEVGSLEQINRMTETCRWIEQQSVVPNLPTAPPRTSQERKLQQPNWAEIPTDALSVIFQKLGALNVLVSGQAVCHPWRQLALDPTQEFWRCIDMRRLKTTTSSPSKAEAERLARAAVDRSGGNIEELHVMSVSEGFLRYTANRATNMRCCGLIRVFPLSPEVLVDFVRCLPLLEELHIYKCLFSRETYGDIGRACPQLKCLWVDGKYDSDDDVDSESEYDLLKRRRSWSGISASNARLRKSRRDKIRANFNLEPHQDANSNLGQPRDPEYDLSKDDTVALEIANTMPQLRELRLIMNINLTQKGLNAILDKCLSLEYLDIRRCYDVRVDDTLYAKLAKIKSVRLSRRSRISLADELASNEICNKKYTLRELMQFKVGSPLVAG